MYLKVILKISLGSHMEFGFRRNLLGAFHKCPNAVIHHNFQAPVWRINSQEFDVVIGKRDLSHQFALLEAKEIFLACLHYGFGSHLLQYFCLSFGELDYELLICELVVKECLWSSFLSNSSTCLTLEMVEQSLSRNLDNSIVTWVSPVAKPEPLTKVSIFRGRGSLDERALTGVVTWLFLSLSSSCAPIRRFTSS